jgi:nitrile hydratase subunit alpha
MARALTDRPHRLNQIPRRDTFAENNLLSRGREIAVEVDDSDAVDLIRCSRTTLGFSMPAPSGDPTIMLRRPSSMEGSMDHDHQELPSDPALRVMALESLLVEKGLVDSAALDALIDTYEHKIGPRNGARVVARAWVDPEFKKRLLADAGSAAAEFGYVPQGKEHLVALENTPGRHNLVVCTLCSCYPWPVLGLPPVWYKSAPYRSRAVIDPRGVLREFGLEISEDVEIRIWDSTSEMRYLVLPERPAGSEQMSEDELAALVTRDAMIGTAKVTLAGASR